MPAHGRGRRRPIGSITLFLGFALIAACDPPRELSPAAITPEQADRKPKVQSNIRIAALPKSGDVVLIGGWSKGNESTATAEFFSQTSNKFNKLGSMAVSEAAGVAALLTENVPHPEVLVAGGFSGSSKFTHKGVSDTIVGSAKNNLQILDPATGKFISASSALLRARFGATATELPSGKVLIAGGAASGGNPTATAEVFDPVTGSSSATANNMTSSRMFHSATLLNDGTVLLAGGASDNTADLTASADLYDPDTNTFTGTGPMATARGGQAAVLLASGDVLVAGGVVFEAGLTADNHAEIYDATHGIFTPVPNLMNDTRGFHTATLLSNGTVLIVGGFSNFFGSTVSGSTGKLSNLFGSSLSSAEIFDPSAGTFSCLNGTNGKGGHVCGAAMKMARGAHSATIFQAGPLAGRVLIAGGLGAKKPNSTSTELSEAELFTPGLNSFKKISSLAVPRGLHAAVLLP
jgi:WD40 repeat protein